MNAQAYFLSGAADNAADVASRETDFFGQLADLLVAPDALEAQRAYANRLPSIQLSERSVCDLELLATGGFSPLNRFMDQADYTRVLAEMRLANGQIFPIPITLPVAPSPALKLDSDVALRNSKNDLLAILTIEEIYNWDLNDGAQVFHARPAAPAVAEMHRWDGQPPGGCRRPAEHADFRPLRLTPAQARTRLAEFGRDNVVATRNPLPRA
jgi:sulfate adenylyltransferase